MTTLVHAEQNDDAHRASGSTYILTREDLAEAAAQSTAAQQIYGPLSVALNANTFGSVLDLAERLRLNCLTQKCEDMLSAEEFELTTGSSTTDNHSVVRWAHIAQKHHLLALQIRCERFMCENFHHILDDPLLQDLTRHSLLRMLRAQSAMVSVYKQHVVCPQTWGLASVGAHGARPVGNHTDAVTGESDNCSALDMDISSDDATTEYSNESDSGSEPDEITSTADSHAVTSKRFGNRSTGRAALPRSWSHPGFPALEEAAP